MTMPDEVFIDKTYPDTQDNRFSLKDKPHREMYVRRERRKNSYMEELKSYIEDTRVETKPEKQRIVSAACRMSDGTIFMGIRHFSADMRMMITLAGYNDKLAGADQGFVDQWFNFLTREEAFKIALSQGQYRPYPPFNFGTLYSEDLY